MTISEEHPDISQTGRGQGQNTLEGARGCARAPPAPWHHVSHCHHHCCRAGQARASRWLLALPAPPGTAQRCLPSTVPIRDRESLRGAEGTQSHARGDAGELPPQDVAPMSPASFTAPWVSAKGVSAPPPPSPVSTAGSYWDSQRGRAGSVPFLPTQIPRFGPFYTSPSPFPFRNSQTISSTNPPTGKCSAQLTPTH